MMRRAILEGGAIGAVIAVALSAIAIALVWWHQDEDSEALTRYREQVALLGEELEGGVIDGNEYRHARKVLDERLRANLPERGMEDVVQDWFGLFEEATSESGRVDYDLLDGLQGEFREAHPEIDDELAELEGHEPVSQEYRRAQDAASEYARIPLYKNISRRDGVSVMRFLASARDMVRYGRVPDMDWAIRTLGIQNPRMAVLARLALKYGPNPEREWWLTRNPGKANLLRKFHLGGPISVLEGAVER